MTGYSRLHAYVDNARKQDFVGNLQGKISIYPQGKFLEVVFLLGDFRQETNESYWQKIGKFSEMGVLLS